MTNNIEKMAMGICARTSPRLNHGRKKDEMRERKSEGGKFWIQGAIKHPGALHKSLHVPQGEKIPMSKIKKAEHSSNPTLRRRANLAETLKRMHH